MLLVIDANDNSLGKGVWFISTPIRNYMREIVGTFVVGIAVVALFAFTFWTLRIPYPAYDPAAKTYTFYGYTCKVKCQGHVAGYEWAKENLPEVKEQCYRGENRKSFYEGCAAWVSRMEIFN